MCNTQCIKSTTNIERQLIGVNYTNLEHHQKKTDNSTTKNRLKLAANRRVFYCNEARF